MIKAIIFDLWDTIGSKGFAINKHFLEYFNIEKSPDYHKKYERAVQITKWSSKKEMAASFLKTFNLPLTEENLNHVIETYEKGISNAKLIEGMKEILVKLSEKYKLALISNTTNFEIGFIDKFDIRKFFEVVIGSHDIGKLKPSKEIFMAVAKEFSSDSLSEFLFIDDSEKNINEARKLGMKTILFQNKEQLMDELNKLNIL